MHQLNMGNHIIENIHVHDVHGMLQRIQASGHPAVLMVFSNNCGPCTILDKDLLQLAIKYPGYTFHREDVDRNLSSNITHLPTFRIIGPEGVIEDESRSASMIKLEKMIRLNMIHKLKGIED